MRPPKIISGYTPARSDCGLTHTYMYWGHRLEKFLP